MAARLGFAGALALLALLTFEHAEGFSIATLGQFKATHQALTHARPAHRRSPLQLDMMAVGSASKLAKALKKPTGAMTVSFQVCAPVAKLGPTDIDALSMTLRKAKAASLFVHADAAPALAREQATAKGNFPGPCPVIVWGGEGVAQAKAAGASGVLVPLGALGAEGAAAQAAEAAAGGLDAVWEVASVEEAKAAADAGALFVVARGACLENGAATLAALPKGCVAVAAVEAMQEGGGEVGQAKALKALGFHSFLVEEACVGDAEDLPFAKWAVAEMSSKQSQEFKITGMTGHVNGHYGTGTFEKTQAVINWKRKA